MADQKKEDNTLTEAVAVATRIAVETAMKVTHPQQAVKAFCIPTGQACAECGQGGFITEKGLKYACNSNHVKMVVLPQEADHFPGICLGGVWYWSRDSRPITVPAENDFAEILNKWDAQERENKTGRKVNPSRYNPVSRPPKADVGG